MLFTEQLLQQLEQNQTLKRSYAGGGSLGQNKWVVLPLVLVALGGFGAYSFYDISKSDASYTTWMWVCLALVVAGIIAVVVIQSGAKKKVLAGNLDEVSVCLAKKIAGNEQADVYYGIYTPGSKRHDAAFIETVADRIYHIHDEPDLTVKRRIADLFSPTLIGTHATPTLLPAAISFGEQVYHKEFKLGAVDAAMKQHITENDGRFLVLSYNNISIPVVKSLPADS